MKLAVAIATGGMLFGYAVLLAQAPADGAKPFERVCTSCHAVDTVSAERHSRTEWKSVVEDMLSRGADATADEGRAVVEYLTKTYGNIPINKLAARDLEKEMNLTPEEAAAIVKYREQNGPFHDFDTLRKAPGVPTSKLESYRNSFVF